MTTELKQTVEEWRAEGARRFGPDPMKWKFICPVCEHVQSVEDYKNAKAPQEAVAFSCVGRWIEGSKDAFERKGKGPCTYAGGGLIRLNPRVVVYPDEGETQVFEFAPLRIS